MNECVRRILETVLNFFTVTLHAPASEKGVGGLLVAWRKWCGQHPKREQPRQLDQRRLSKFAFLAAVNVVPGSQAAASEEPTRLRGAAAE